MKNIERTHIWIWPTVAVALLTVSACASSAMQRSQQTRTSLETVDEDIQEASRQLDATESSLEALMRPGQTDIRQAFESYSDNVQEMAEIEDTLAKHAEQMEAQGADYFGEWEKAESEYSNARIQQLSDERRGSLKQVYDRIAQASIGVDGAFKNYVSDLQEIRSFLANDLTEKGVAAIEPVAAQTNSRGNELRRSIQDVQGAIQDARAEMELAGAS